jgi:hypothetical protein
MGSARVAVRLVRTTRTLASLWTLRGVDDFPAALFGGLPDLLAVASFRDAVMI